MPTLDDEIRALEERLLNPVVRAAATELAELVSTDFVEFGSSGRVYDKRATLATLTAGAVSAVPATIAEFRVRALSPDVVLATYRTESSLRSSIWRRENGAWRVVFHQGTPSPKAGG